MHERKIRLGVVGLGWVSQNRHLPAIVRNNRFQLVFVADSKKEQAEHVASRYGVMPIKAGSELADGLGQVDALIIGAPPFAHMALAENALTSGKHVLTEKPFVMTPCEGEHLVALAAQHRVRLGVVHNFQFSRSFKALLQDIETARLGRILAIQAVQQSNPRRRLPEWYENLPGGLFFDESPHLLYLLRRLVPNLAVARVDVTKASTNTPVFVHASFHNQGGVPVMMHMNFQASVSEWQLMVHGENGVGCVDLFRDIYMRVPNDRTHLAFDVLKTSFATLVQHFWGTWTSGMLHVRHRLDYGNSEVFDRFARAISFNETLCPIAGEDALAVLRMQHDILERGGLA